MSCFNFMIILLVGFVDYLGIALVYPIFAALLFDPAYPMLPVEASAGYRGALLGVLIAFTPLSQFASTPFLGAFSDRKGRRPALILGTGIGCLGYGLAILGILMHSLSLLFLYRLLVGISEGTAAVAQAALADMSTEENKAKHFSWLNSSLGLGFMIGPFLGGKLADPSFASWCSYALPFIFAGFLSIINLLLVFFKFPETHLSPKSISFNWKEEVKNIQKIFFLKYLRGLFIAGFSLAFGWSFFNEFIPVFLRIQFNFTTSQIGNFYAYNSAWYAISAGLAAAPLLKVCSAEKLVSLSLIGCACFMLSLLLAPSSPFIWLAMPFVMYFLALVFPTIASTISNRVAQERQGEVLGAYQSIQAFAMGLSPLLFGSAVGLYPALAVWGGALALLLASSAAWIGCKARSNVNV